MSRVDSFPTGAIREPSEGLARCIERPARASLYDAAMTAPLARFVACALIPCAGAVVLPQDAAPPGRALDPRIDASRLTRLGPPDERATAGQVRRPVLAPVLRIATRAEAVPLDDATFAKAQEAIRRGLAHLARTQTTRGTWFDAVEVAPTDMEPRKRASSVAVTALALKAFAQAGAIGAGDARDRARVAVLAAVGDANTRAAVTEGGIGNYAMSAVASGLSAAGDADAQAGAAIAVRWLQEGQWDDAEGVTPDMDWYGGAGYGNGKRPDLSNTQLMLDALHDAGVSPDDPAVARALAFVARTQNRKASNPASWAQDGSGDGGFVYSPANGGESMASEAAGEGRHGEKLATRSLRSYGSMTYAGFKSLLYAGLSPDDPRVRDALGWIALHFTFDENPGLGQQGYFYYLHAMSRALFVSALTEVTDAKGDAHDWRRELVEALVARQRTDGSWANEVARWEESNADLATIYAVLALEEAVKPRPTQE
ncbi:MAG: hypothetical protein RIS86_1824 [Planctomycetota bacterium]